MKLPHMVLFWVVVLIVLTVVELTTGAVSNMPPMPYLFPALLLGGVVVGFVIAKRAKR